MGALAVAVAVAVEVVFPLPLSGGRRGDLLTRRWLSRAMCKVVFGAGALHAWFADGRVVYFSSHSGEEGLLHCQLGGPRSHCVLVEKV